MVAGSDIEALEAEFGHIIDQLMVIDSDDPASDRHRIPLEARLDVIRPLLVAAEKERS